MITCHCADNKSLVTCIENVPSAETFINWSTFLSDEHQHYSFNLINFTSLTSYTFTNFSLTFPLLRKVEFNFTNGIDNIAENIFGSFNYVSDMPIYIRFESPRNFQLADYAFNQMKYLEITIDNIQYNNIHNLPYQFNLKAFDNTHIFQINIRNSKEVQLISNQSSSLKWEEVQFNNCSLTNVDLLIESLSSESLIKLDLSFNKLIHIPSLVKFIKMTSIDLHDNSIEEIKLHIFSNLTNLYELDLSFNQIKHISPDAFIGLKNLTILLLNHNHLTSLETVTIHNEVTSFLFPLNETLRSLMISNNLLHDFNPIQNLSHIETLIICCNQIKKLDENSLKNAHKLQTIDLSHNHIESIHPLTFNRTILQNLDLSSNFISSLETTKIVYDEHFQPKNRTTSFLDGVAPTLVKLSLANSTNLVEINWFVFTKLEKLSSLDLSRIIKTDRFWLFESRDDTPMQSNHHSDNIDIILNHIQFKNDDYCLSKPIFEIFNQTTLFLDQNHPCNCFIFMLKNIISTQQHLICLTNDSFTLDLAQQCMNIDSHCLSMENTTTIPPTQSTSLSSTSSTTTELSSSSSSTTSYPTTESSSLSSSSLSTSSPTTTSTISISTISTTMKTEQSSTSTLTTLITTTKILTTLGAANDNGKWKTTLAIMIPLTVIIIVLSLVGVYIVKRQKKNKLKENIEMDGAFVNPFAKK
ncbi:unnamed protein product [Adineta steineri]|uniref:Uncharacterized protein n=1 Tax=Adineta steineri TaxID=433720 RepID=A0A818I5N3_9BILA|nr:unnamed protein product [Adineta steineri]CAF3519335.1 unnamed protein product [Adineta steineri]